MAKDEKSTPPSTYVTGYCGVGNHARCPATIKSNFGGRVWECHCRCHAEGNTGWEPPPEVAPLPRTAVSTIDMPGPTHFSITLPLEEVHPEVLALIFGEDWDKVRLVEGLREVLTKLDTET